LVLSDRLGSPAPRSLLKKTLIYVLAFGLGALALSALLGFALTSLAEGMLPKPKERPAAVKPDAKTKTGDDELPEPGKSFKPGKPVSPPSGSKTRPPRGNDAADGETESEDQAL
jgi:hypothetical protein